MTPEERDAVVKIVEDRAKVCAGYRTFNDDERSLKRQLVREFEHAAEEIRRLPVVEPIDLTGAKRFVELVAKAAGFDHVETDNEGEPS